MFSSVPFQHVLCYCRQHLPFHLWFIYYVYFRVRVSSIHIFLCIPQEPLILLAPTQCYLFSVYSFFTNSNVTLLFMLSVAGKVCLAFRVFIFWSLLLCVFIYLLAYLYFFYFLFSLSEWNVNGRFFFIIIVLFFSSFILSVLVSYLSIDSLSYPFQ